MNETLYKLCEMLNQELMHVVQNGDINAGNLPVVDQLTHALKSVKAIIKMEEDSSEQSYAGGSYMDYSRDGGYSGRRDSMGRYSREGGAYRGGYSRAEDRDRLKEQLEERMRSAGSEQEREVLRQAMRVIDQH